MPSAGELTSLAQDALLLSIAVSIPVVAVAALVGFIVSVFQAATQLQDPTLGHLPRLIVVACVLALLGPWIGSQIAAFAARAFSGG